MRKAGSSKEEERVELVIHDTPEGPIFHLDGETYRVLDVPALWEVARRIRKTLLFGAPDDRFSDPQAKKVEGEVK